MTDLVNKGDTRMPFQLDESFFSHFPFVKFRLWGVFVAALFLVFGLMVPDARAETFNHSSFDRLLQSYVKDGTVDYKGLQRDESQLDAYLATLANAPFDSMNRAEQMALLINSYNACTLKLILRHYGKIASIKDIKNPWKTKEWKIGGKTLSLDEMENTYLRGKFKDPRIHFSIVCASVGCPSLQPHAFLATSLDEQLESAFRGFAASTEHVLFSDSGNPRLSVSKIFEWFGDDFQQGGKTFVDGLIEHVPAALAATLRKKRSALTVDFLPFDWSFNDRK